jgi:NADPH:quinone reductase-like Zn-dependent oxidoreductase
MTTAVPRCFEDAPDPEPGPDQVLVELRAASLNHLDIWVRKGLRVVIEHVGEATWKRSLDAVRPNGRICVCGATTGPNPPANLHRIWWKQLTVYGSTMGSKDDFEAVYDLVTSGRLSPIVDSVFPLEDAAAAHTRLETGDQLGKIVLRIPR